MAKGYDSDKIYAPGDFTTPEEAAARDARIESGMRDARRATGALATILATEGGRRSLGESLKERFGFGGRVNHRVRGGEGRD